MRKVLLSLFLVVGVEIFADSVTDYVNPFIGTTNFGTCNPGAVCPNGMMSVVPFNVMGSDLNVYDKDARWFSTPYEYKNCFFTGYSHVNLSGVGCPDLGSLLLMPTTGALEVDYKKYGSTYKNEYATPGYYSNFLEKYGITTEVSATERSSIARFTFPKGEANILLNLGEGLTNESGAMVRKVSETEVEGVKLLGTFCYNPQAVFPIYFVMRVNKVPNTFGYWKKQRQMQGVEAEWDIYSGKYKFYTNYSREISGDDIGVYFCYDAKENEQIEVQIGVSFVSMENARKNLDAEQPTFDFEKTHQLARTKWERDLGVVQVEGGTADQKTVFYTALYHALIHPNVLQDVNGEYPQMEGDKVLTAKGNRYTVFSLWDTYRNVHQLLTLLYPERQLDMIRTMLAMYKEHGWLPKWELYSRETLTMEGDPSIPVIVDTWMKGLRDFDVNLAYEAMCKGATTPGKDNLMRPDIDPYIEEGYVPLGFFSADASGDNSVSHALEYYIADWALSQMADKLGKKADAKMFYNRSMGYKHYYCPKFGTLRPLCADGKFLEPFNPLQGANFEPVAGFHEGNAWNYTFYVPHDIKGLIKLMGGKKRFVQKLQMVFDKNYYDPANEPDIAYPYLFSNFNDEAWRTQKEVTRLLETYFRNAPDGIPGNDDTGTMSAWAVFSMMGFYPDCPGKPSYMLTTPTFDKVVLNLNEKYYPKGKLVIEKTDKLPYIQYVKAGEKLLKGYVITHEELTTCGTLLYKTKK